MYNPKRIQEYTYFVRGAHCASCELLIEKKLSRLKGVRWVQVSAKRGQVLLACEELPPSVETLNQIFVADGYVFSNQPFPQTRRSDLIELLRAMLIGGALIAAFLALEGTGLTGAIALDKDSSLAALFVFGILAGLSSCAALVGGMVLSFSRQWLSCCPMGASFFRKAEPHLLFNVGRLSSYALFGALLGAAGGLFDFSGKISGALVAAVALLMIILGLQMLGMPPFTRFRLALPKFITRRISDEQRFQGRVMPFVLGALTFFLPCGFTVTAQGLALLSGNPLQGGLIMLAFALGTLPMLLLIGLSSTQLLQARATSSLFTKVAGIVVLFFAVWTIQARLTVLGLAPLQRLRAQATAAQVVQTQPSQRSPTQTNPTRSTQAQRPQGNSSTAAPTRPTTADRPGDLPPLVDGKQLVRMTASASSYEPRTFKVQVGVPVRLEITDVGTSGCTNAIVFPAFFPERIKLTRGQTTIKEFIPQKVGVFKYSCWMGMVTGTVQVVE